MWIAGLCAFPPLFSGEPIDLSHEGASIIRSFHAPVEKGYLLAVKFDFPSTEARLADKVVGDRYSEMCQGEIPHSDIPDAQRKGLGQPIPFRVVIRKAADRAVILDRTFISLCLTSDDGKNSKTRTIGWVQLAVGDYMAEITNLERQSGLPSVKTTISLYAGQGK